MHGSIGNTHIHSIQYRRPRGQLVLSFNPYEINTNGEHCFQFFFNLIINLILI